MQKSAGAADGRTADAIKPQAGVGSAQTARIENLEAVEARLVLTAGGRIADRRDRVARLAARLEGDQVRAVGRPADGRTRVAARRRARLARLRAVADRTGRRARIWAAPGTAGRVVRRRPGRAQVARRREERGARHGAGARWRRRPARFGERTRAAGRRRSGGGDSAIGSLTTIKLTSI